MYKNIRFGADPELFLVNSHGRLVSAVGKIGGTKQCPRPIDDLGAAVQEDNVAVEFNIAPASGVREFIRNLYTPLKYIEKYVKEMELSPHIVPSAIFPEDQLESTQAQEFGCEPDYNVWTGKVNPRPKAKGSLAFLRTCGGHLHVSWDEPTMEQRRDLVKSLDLFLGVPSVLMDSDSRRRVLYGRAGAHRPKRYGVEYRVLSNFWIRSPKAMKWAFEQSTRAVRFLNEGNTVSTKARKNILSAINSNNLRVAGKLTKEFQLVVI